MGDKRLRAACTPVTLDTPCPTPRLYFSMPSCFSVFLKKSPAVGRAGDKWNEAGKQHQQGS